MGATRRSSRYCLLSSASFAVALLLTPILAAQSASGDGRSDYLRQVRLMTEVAAQKMETDVRAALREAQRVGKTDPAAAAEALKQVLVTVEQDSVVPPARRDILAKALRDRIAALEKQSKRPAVAPPPPPPSVNPRRRAEEESRAAEYQKIRAAMERIQSLRKDGQTEEARRHAEELAKQYAADPTLQAAERTAAAADQAAANRGQRSEAERRLAAISRDVSRSATPPLSEMDYPEDWVKRVKSRSGMDGSLSAEDKAILKALNTSVSVDFKGAGIEQVVQYLSNATKQPIMLDRAALSEAQISYDTPVTVKLDGVPLRTVLKRILSDLGLAYVIKDQSLQITSSVRAKETMITRTYYMGDLLAQTGVGNFAFPLGNPGNSFGFPVGNPNSGPQVAQQAAQIMDSIQASIEPASWQKNGGSGTITFSAPMMALIIRQSAEVHAMIAGGL
jgi:hypothetical protein